MRMNNTFFPFIPIIFVALSVGLISYYSFKDKSAYVDNNVLFKEFIGTKELEDNAKQRLAVDKRTIDSLNKLLLITEQYLKNKNPSFEELSAYRQLADYNDSLKYVYQDNISTVNSEIATQVWSSLNQYIVEYGKENDYDYIFGASGNGSLMFANEDCDITQEILKYSNNKYEGH